MAESSADEASDPSQQSTESLPPEASRTLNQALLGSDIIGPLALLNKLNAEHLTQILASRDEEAKLVAKDRELQRKHFIAVLLIAIVSLGLLLFLLSLLDMRDHVGPILAAIAAAFGGWGIAKSRS
ncbi:MAG: hypothetical protein OXM03_04925 [Chloroflexota bacterium]|nr:hypothetical protein [Chloroflexota bacterium]MDE2839951.1 hypothetical protein [Chloroflexota bacterium]MDE2931633.1 hypothetical protein [Chloroflexota bacterium]